MNIDGLPLMKPPYGTISAINLDTEKFCGKSRTAKRRMSFAILRRLKE